MDSKEKLKEKTTTGQVTLSSQWSTHLTQAIWALTVIISQEDPPPPPPQGVEELPVWLSELQT